MTVKHKKRRMMILYVILVLVGAVAVFIMCAPVFGDGREAARQDNVQSSPQFTDGKFTNQAATTMMTRDEGSDGILYGLKNMLLPPEGKNPQAPLPSVTFDKEKFNNGDVAWLGHSTALFKTNDTVIVIDPVFHRASPLPVFGKPFAYENPTTHEDLPEKIDVVLISHDHYDHLDYKTILQIADRVERFIVPLGVGAHLRRWGIAEEKITQRDWHEQARYNDITFTLTPTQHFSGRSLGDSSKTLWGAWIVRSATTNIYAGGDSGYNAAFAEVGAQYGPFDLALVESGAYNASWAQIHMMPEESVQAGRDLQARLVLPVHWAKFDLAYHPWSEPIERFTKEAEAKQQPYTTPRIGEIFNLENPPQERWWESL